MSAIRDGRVPILLDRERHMLFSLNVMDAVEDEIGDIENLGEMMAQRGRMKKIRWLFTMLLNEGAADGEEQLTESQVGKMIHGGNINIVQRAIMAAFHKAARGDEKSSTAEDDDEEDE